MSARDLERWCWRIEIALWRASMSVFVVSSIGTEAGWVIYVVSGGGGGAGEMDRCGGGWV